MKAILRQVRISPKKANLIAQLVRTKKATDAVDTLKFTPKKGALILRKVIESAMANAENNFNQKRENLYIKEIIVTEGPTYKRSIPVSRGRAHPLLKRTSHITAKLEAAEIKPETKPEAKAKTKVKKETKVEEKAEIAEEPETKTEEPKK